ncbi:DNA polymerase III subunit delta [Roseimaritima sediminicola]|uniref:DNA polymerase III subunit delta n=1 Tax=Roseimaritima sediminicola TaxID=2662066 RepID=UPI0012983B99|nr:DNA polymerase III subunit delta [Roseimaritima sediminicola]
MPLLHAFDLLTEPPEEAALPPVVLLIGNDSTLRSWCRTQLSAGQDESEVEGDTVQWGDLRDDLSTASLFSSGQPRMVVVRGGDALVKRYRTELEDYVAAPSKAGRLLMEIDTLASNTRLYKAASKQGWLVQCKPPTIQSGRSTRPDHGRIRSFLQKYIAPRHRCRITSTATDRLLDLVGDDIGMLDTELAKLAVNLPVDGEITDGLVDDVVAGWQGKTMWEIIDAAASGNAAVALEHVDRLMGSGQRPIALLPQLAWSLRRLGMTTAAVDAAEQRGRRIGLSDALRTAGFRGRPQDLKQAEQQLKQLGRERARQILPWLLAADLKLKGSHSSEGRDRWVLEELFLRLARTR